MVERVLLSVFGISLSTEQDKHQGFYIFADNNPVMFFDALGLKTDAECYADLQKATVDILLKGAGHGCVKKAAVGILRLTGW